jgi:formylglycine-generating enzyme required for sulfatase activity
MRYAVEKENRRVKNNQIVQYVANPLLSVVLFFSVLLLNIAYAAEPSVAGIDGAEMILIPEGEFIMGLSEDEAGSENNPYQKVFLMSFYIDKYEVTNFRYKKCIRAGICRQPSLIIDNPKTIFEDGKQWFSDKTMEQYPVVGLSWEQASLYCSWAGKRLPLPAEWEKAARGSDGRTYPWGNNWDETKANWDENGRADGYRKLAPVGSYPEGRSPYGVMDMAGNVRELVNSLVFKGGSWYSYPKSLRSGDPGHGYIVERDDDIGFRCAKYAEQTAHEKKQVKQSPVIHKYLYDEYTKER